MATPLFQVDAFTTRRFSGNPAAVMLFAAFPSDEMMQAMAAENNLAETAFLVPNDGAYRLRWFTPTVEVPLCGHATLASAAVVTERLEPSRTQVVFHTASGLLTVVRRPSGSYVMDFPSRPSERISPPPAIAAALGAEPTEVHVNEFNYLVRFETADVVRHLAPDMGSLQRLDRTGVIVTAPGDTHHDFISRYFAPAKGIPEDPVTGGAHCMLAPYWSARLGKTEMRAWQASRRGGEIVCRVMPNGRVELEGHCVFYLEGQVQT